MQKPARSSTRAAAVYPEPSIPRWVYRLVQAADHRERLTAPGQANIPESDLPMLASDAMFQQRLLINNPREVDEPTALQLYREAWVVGRD